MTIELQSQLVGVLASWQSYLQHPFVSRHERIIQVEHDSNAFPIVQNIPMGLSRIILFISSIIGLSLPYASEGVWIQPNHFVIINLSTFWKFIISVKHQCVRAICSKFQLIGFRSKALQWRYVRTIFLRLGNYGLVIVYPVPIDELLNAWLSKLTFIACLKKCHRMRENLMVLSIDYREIVGMICILHSFKWHWHIRRQSVQLVSNICHSL